MANKESIEKRIAEMTLEQKLGMTLCARAFIWHEEDVDYVVELIKKRALGGVQLLSGRPEWNANERILAAAKEADYPLIVITDMEQRAPHSDLPSIPLLCLAACGKKEYYQAFAKGVCRDAKAYGYNGNWGPVVDVLHGDGPCSVSRKLSDDPMKVAYIAEEIATVFKQNHFLSTAKHFPGGKGGAGDVAVDSHLVEAAACSTVEELMEESLPPYKHLMEKGVMDCIMSTHTVYKNIDPERPATVSKKVIDIIRNMGFDGIIFTDSLSMSGIKQRYEQEVLMGMAIAAGHDMLLPCFNTLTKDCMKFLKKNYEDGLITEERLNEAVRRVLTAQDFVGQTPENPAEFTEEDEKLLQNVARDCVTAVTDEGVSPALGTDVKEKLFVVIEEEKKIDEEAGEISISPWYKSKRVAEKIKEEFPEADIEFIQPLSTTSDHSRVLDAVKEHKEVVLVTQCYTTAYLGTDCLTRRSEAILNAVIHTGKVSAIVHFGNPFALKNLWHVPRKIFGYTMQKSQDYSIEVLSGKTEAKGTLPFNVEFQ